MRVFVTAASVLSAAGSGLDSLAAALSSNRRALCELTLWETPNRKPALVGEVKGLAEETSDLPERFTRMDPPLPRTHLLALAAARYATRSVSTLPDAVVLGVTTGGMPATENLLRRQEPSASLYRWHGLGTVTEMVADLVGCRGPALTISTACSSGSAAIVCALELIRSGRVKHVLAGGVDGLCRMTYYGFSMLQLFDPCGCRPLDVDRKGMTVSEGAAMLFLSAGNSPPPGTLGEIAGGALTCDAHHPTSPHPCGEGAAAAMQKALKSGGIEPEDVDYINLHGTGTPDNDLSEARAISAVFGKSPPHLSSTKGIFGHCLAASGGLEALVALDAIRRGCLPPNVGMERIDPELGLAPVTRPEKAKIHTVLSNSLGFGGNNASLVVRSVSEIPSPEGERQDSERQAGRDEFSSFTGSRAREPLIVTGYSCLSGCGGTENTIKAFFENKSCAGRIATKEIGSHLPPRKLRRLGRLSRMALHLATIAAIGNKTAEGTTAEEVDGVFWATGNGPLSETFDFLEKLFGSNEQFSSPVNFSGSVHNAAAGLIAIHFGARGPNVTTTGKTDSFEQALFAAQLFSARSGGDGKHMLVMGADEAHDVLSPRLDPSLQNTGVLSDGGGALCLKPAAITHWDGKEAGTGGDTVADAKEEVRVDVRFLARAGETDETMEHLVEKLGGADGFSNRFGTVFVGLPAEERDPAKDQLDLLLSITNFTGRVMDYRKLLGEYPTATASAVVAAVELVRKTANDSEEPESGEKSVLILGLGNRVSAVEVFSERR